MVALPCQTALRIKPTRLKLKIYFFLVFYIWKGPFRTASVDFSEAYILPVIKTSQM